MIHYFTLSRHQDTRTNNAKSESYKHLILTFSFAKNYCIVSGHNGPSLNCPDTRFRHSYLLKIIAQCPDSLGQVQNIQRHDSNVFACYKLLHSVRTHWAISEPSRHSNLTFSPAINYCTVSTDNWAESEPSRHPILTFLHARNYCTVSGLIGPNPSHPDTRF